MYYTEGFDLELYQIDDNDDLIFVQSIYSSHDQVLAIENASREVKRLRDYHCKRFVVAVRDNYMNQIVCQIYA